MCTLFVLEFKFSCKNKGYILFEYLLVFLAEIDRNMLARKGLISALGFLSLVIQPAYQTLINVVN